jgi:hypothetical protein
MAAARVVPGHHCFVTQHQTITRRTLPPAVVAVAVVVALVLGVVLLKAVVSAVGLTGVLLLAGVLGSFGFVCLTISRRRPISAD